MTLIPLLILILVILAWISISAAILWNLWTKQPGGIMKKLAWSLIALIPLFGWILYGGFYNPPGDNLVEAEGKAAGWAPHWPKRW